MKHIIAGAAAGLLVIGVVGCKPKATTSETTYETATAEIGEVRSFVTATGTIQPWKTVDIKSNVAGRIDKLYVDLGSRVKAGDPIMDIDPTDTRTAKDQADADLKAAEARKSQALIQVEQQRQQANARVAASQRSLESSRSRLAQARANERVQPSLTAAAIEQATAGLAAAQKAKTQAERNLEQLQQQFQTLTQVSIPFDSENSENQVNQARANAETAKNQYRRQQQLIALGYVARSDVETAYARWATSEATYRTSTQRLKTQQQENEIAIREMRARIQEAESRIDEAGSRISQSKAQLESAKQNSVQVEVRQFERTAAEAAVKEAESQLESAKAELRSIELRERDVLTAESQIVRSRAARDQANTNLGYTKVVAPRDGIVLLKNVEEGTVVPSSRGSIGSTNALIQIGDTSKLWITCNVDETDIGQVQTDQKVTIKVDAYPSAELDGKVIRIDPQAKVEQNVTLIPVTVEISDPDERFKPLMNAECEFIVDEASDVLTVPNEALKEDSGVSTVQKMSKDGKTPEKDATGKLKDFEVEVGIAGPDRTEIKAGLAAGDIVITKVVVPEKPQANNPFNPFGGMGGNRGGGGTRPGGGGGTGGGGGARGGGR